MSKKTKKIDSNQFDLNFGTMLDHYITYKKEFLQAIDAPTSVQQIENEFEACIEIAAAIKRALRESGLSREQLVDAINTYFNRTEAGTKTDPPTCRRPLTINMLNNYLSKPTEVPIPSYYLYAIHHVTGSFEPAQTIVTQAGARIATGSELRQMAIGKLEETIAEMQKIKKELNGKCS